MVGVEVVGAVGRPPRLLLLLLLLLFLLAP
jgi:hypothetical protein